MEREPGTAQPQAPGRSSGRVRESAPLNPPEVKNTDSAVPLHRGPVEHRYTCTGPAPGELLFRWAHGSIVAAKNTDPRIQTMRYNEDTFVLRQNICVHWKGPFTYLLFGNQGALLIDTGATANPAWYPLRRTVDELVQGWEVNRGKPDLPLTVAFTSGEYRDQTEGLSQFAGRPHTTAVPRELDSMQQFFRFSRGWPDGTAEIDLGGRVIDVIPTPGAHRDGISFYDRYTQLLFTGDLLFPGRIAIANQKDYVRSLERLQSWRASHGIKWVLGGHIDMQFLPGKAYGRFATFKPYERELQLSPQVIDEALATAREIEGKRMVLARADFWMLHGAGLDQRPEAWPQDLPNITAPRPV